MNFEAKFQREKAIKRKREFIEEKKSESEKKN